MRRVETKLSRLREVAPDYAWSWHHASASWVGYDHDTAPGRGLAIRSISRPRYFQIFRLEYEGVEIVERRSVYVMRCETFDEVIAYLAKRARPAAKHGRDNRPRPPRARRKKP